MPRPVDTRIKRPARVGQATSRAQAPSFKEQSRGGAVNLDDPSPFPSMDLKNEFIHYDYPAQDDIRAAIAIPDVAARFRSAHGSGAELVLLGRLVKDEWTYGEEVIWQGEKLPGLNRLSGPQFVSDLYLNRYIPTYVFVDGARFHLATLVQMVHDWERNNRAAQGSRKVLVLPAEMCLVEEQMLAYLGEKGVLT